MFSFRTNALQTLATASLIVALTLALMSVGGAQCAPQERTAGIVKGLAGDWIGTCEQSTDGEEADNKYFHANFKQTGDDTFTGKFTYYRFDANTREPLNVGEMTVSSTVQPDGTITNEIVGKGKMLVYDKPKDEEHKLTEVLTLVDANTLTGKIDGRIDVQGMPFGLGKNGEIRNATSTWTLNDDGVMTIEQSFKARFKVLMFSKSFSVKAKSVAQRGTDIVGLMKKDLASKPVERPAQGS